MNSLKCGISKNEETVQNRNRPVDVENKLMVAKVEEGMRMKKPE